MKRFLRIDIEYDTDVSEALRVTSNIRQILREDMPYVKVLFTRDTPTRDELDKERARP